MIMLLKLRTTCGAAAKTLSYSGDGVDVGVDELEDSEV
jgi:hypothetical protein